jgi:hypothetical protein
MLKYMYCVCCLESLPNRLLLASIPITICVFGLLWMDWTLGVVTGNLVGVPAKSAKALYWTYCHRCVRRMLQGVSCSASTPAKHHDLRVYRLPFLHRFNYHTSSASPSAV